MRVLIPLVFKDDRVLLKQVDGVWTPPTGEFSFSSEKELPQQASEITKLQAGVPSTFASLTEVRSLGEQEAYVVAMTTSVEDVGEGWQWRPLSLLPDALALPKESITNATRILTRVQKNANAVHPFQRQLQRIGAQYQAEANRFLNTLQSRQSTSLVEWPEYTELLKRMYVEAGKYGLQLLNVVKQADLSDEIKALLESRAEELSESQRQRLLELIEQYIAAGMTLEEALQKALTVFRNVNVYAAAMTAPNFAFHQAATIVAIEESVDYAVYHTARDERVCPQCAPREGKVVRIDTSPYYENLPAIHPHCRCWMLFYTSLDEVREQEGEEIAPAEGVSS